MAGKRKTIVPDLDDLRRSKRSNMGQGGRLTQLQKLESSQMNRQRPVKKNPAQEMIDSQPVNVMAPEAPIRKPRARPIKATKTSSNEKTERHLSSSNLPQRVTEDKPTSHPRSPDSRFGFVPPPPATSERHFIRALSRFNSTPSGSSQPNTPKRTLTGAHSRKHDNLRHHSKSDTSRALPASKPVPLEHTPAVVNHRCPNTSLDTPVTSDSNPPTDLESDYTRPSRMNISDAEAPLHGDEGYDSGRDHDVDANNSDLDNSDARTNDVQVDHGNDGDSGEADQDVDVDNLGVDQDDGDSFVDDPHQDHDTSKDSNDDEFTRARSRVADSSHNARDVLQDHRAKNCRPRMPDLDELETLRRRATTQDSAQSSSEEEVVVPRKRTRMIKATAQNIRFYPPSWKDLLEAAKKKSRLGLLTSTASKRSDFLKTKGIEYLLETLEDFGSQGVGVDDGYWDEYKSDMAVLLWDDRATMRSEMKKAARPIVLAHYEILPPDVDDENDYEREVRDNVKTLLQNGAFLRDGGRTNNLANEALGSFCMSYFYKGENALAKSFPDLFADAVPEGAVALAATALAAAIDEYKTGTYKQMKFVADLYQPIYDSVIQLYHDVQKDHYHAKKCRAARKKWARTAGILTRDDPNRRHDWGLKLQLD
ncbi:hypothetical protein DFJ58DRAFT_733737 [Suillus subalutaceus]|uniref:uncharacterized protein n=1 Tax=Suillus subalutaceus TaxID=48586 RepID=UPI001B8636A4|nr:uncharacterized protein DFJ58DRAFT_733737 [Suillus subalutaceus]KAG1838569.1 hypothetical protein DFJ58DRAFT_733737 [Suillus subalutaceus]